jgi:Zn-dependent protease
VELLKLECLGQPLILEGSMAGWQQLYWGGNVVSQIAASSDANAELVHHFEIHAKTQQGENEIEKVSEQAQIILCRLQSTTDWQPFSFNYQFFINDELISQGERDTKDIEQQVSSLPKPETKNFSFLGIAALGMKLLKSAKIVKVLMAGASLAAYTWLFSFQFAIALIACLVFHEYGHIRAMKYFGMKTKGIYLIPFLGGAAVTEDKINTRWQDVAISMMGPCFGLFLSIILIVIYWMTGMPFFAGVAVFNALLNIINLLPVLPLDGGHVLKSISFSMNNTLGIVICAAAAGGGILLSYSMGLYLFSFLMGVGSLEILMEWRTRHQSHLLPLDRYGQIFAGVWYTVLVSSLIAIIWYFGKTGDAAMQMPLKILQS